VPSPGAIAASLFIVIAIAIAASLYPLRIALKTPPVKAMQE